MKNTKTPGALLHVIILMAMLCSGCVGKVVAEELISTGYLSDTQRYALNIPSGRAVDTLDQLAAQTGLEFVFPYDIAETRITRSVVGEYTATQALSLMLKGSGLSSGLSKKGAVRIFLSEGSEQKFGDDAMNVTTKKTMLAAVISFFAGSSGLQVLAEESAADGEGNVWALEEVVVTAQKRGDQILQDVPISIAVLGGTDLDVGQYQSVNDALKQVAGVNLYASTIGSASKISVRGVTASAAQFNGSSTVGYYVDEIPFGLVRSAIVPNPNAYDLERVEILRGPQGTLYGASSLNGVVRILTKDANLQEFEAKVRTSLSKTQDGGENYRGDVAVNIPIIEDKFAARAVIGYNDISGWIDKPNDDDANDSEISSYRLKLNARPTDNFSAELLLWAQRDDLGAPPSALEEGRTPVFIDEPQTVDTDAYVLTLEYDFETFSLMSATNYLDYQNHSELDVVDFDVLIADQDGEVFSQEIRLSSISEGQWQWSMGALYREAEETAFQLLPVIVPDIPVAAFTDKSESFAVFGEVTRSFMDGEFDLTIGLRYFEDDVSFTEDVRYATPEPEPLYRNDDSFDSTTPRIVLTWYPIDDLTVYGSYSQGFRSGFVQTGQVTGPTGLETVEDDLLSNYEVGAKGQGWDGRFIYDLSLYYIDWEDTQQSVQTPIEGTDAVIVTPINGGDASGTGIDLALTVLPAEGLQLGLTLGWNDLTFDSDLESLGTVLFEKGSRTNESPEYTVGVTADYTFAIGKDGYEGRFSGSYNWHDELVNRTIGEDAVVLVSEGEDITNVQMEFAVISPEEWTATVFVDNATNENSIILADGTFPNWSNWTRPRTVGVQFDYQF